LYGIIVEGSKGAYSGSVYNNTISAPIGVRVDAPAGSGRLQIFSNIVNAAVGLVSFMGYISADYNDIQAGVSYYGSAQPGPHDLAIDPQFVYTVDYRLQPGSPCIDAGVEDPDYADVIPPGQGTLRNDMGAYGGPLAGHTPILLADTAKMTALRERLAARRRPDFGRAESLDSTSPAATSTPRTMDPIYESRAVLHYIEKCRTSIDLPPLRARSAPPQGHPAGR